jgi:hypothetical protein
MPKPNRGLFKNSLRRSVKRTWILGTIAKIIKLGLICSYSIRISLSLQLLPRSLGYPVGICIIMEVFHHISFIHLNHSNFISDGEKLHYDIARNLNRICAYDAVMITRVSKGLTVDKYVMDSGILNEMYV